METRRTVIPEAEEVMDQYFPVLDNGFVALKDYMGSDLAIEESARVSYGRGTRKVSDTRTLLRYLFRHRHTSPFEMVELRFHIGLPIFVMRQLVRHRTANLNEYSGRYSIMPLMFYTPKRDQMCRQDKSNRQGRSVRVGEEWYKNFLAELEELRGGMECHYNSLLAEDIARELARIDLPLSTYTYCYWKVDLRNLFNVISLRSDSHAQWEIQQFSDVLAGIVQRLCPVSFEAFQDYQQTAVSFTQLELRAIRLLSTFHVSPISWDNPPNEAKVLINEVLTDGGCTKREADEFWLKLKIQSPRQFNLNLTTAKPGEYFEKIVEQYAIEVPKAA